MIHKGSCHCGKVAYEVEGELGSMFAASKTSTLHPLRSTTSTLVRCECTYFYQEKTP